MWLAALPSAHHIASVQSFVLPLIVPDFLIIESLSGMGGYQYGN